jgi:hypothetical protein
MDLISTSGVGSWTKNLSIPKFKMVIISAWNLIGPAGAFVHAK